MLDELLHAAGRRKITLLYGAKETRHNNAVALKEYIETRTWARPVARYSESSPGAN